MIKGISYNKILIVCTGNICRSPVAEKILKKKKPSLEVKSAGIHGLKGRTIEKNGIDLLKANGYIETDHVARKLNNKMILDADIILTMENFHVQNLIKTYPESSGKIMLLGKWIDDLQIFDPYRKSSEVFVQVFRQIEESCDAWVKVLSKQ